MPVQPRASSLVTMNARRMTSREVAQTFVIPPQYEEITSLDHTFLIGPRGSGKTTLLRMLQGQALMQWQHRRAHVYRRRVSYSTIFLPADRLWDAQMTGLVETTPEAEELATAAFGLQMLSAFVETALYRTASADEYGESVHLPAALRHVDEVEFVHACASAWLLNVSVPSLLGLQTALDQRLASVSSLLERARREAVPSPIWVATDALANLRFGIRAFNRYSRQPEHRWALLLDEMELAPQRIHQALTRSLRGGDPNLILKLSISPVDLREEKHADPRDPVAGHDYAAVYLLHGSRPGTKRFTDGLVRRLLQDSDREYRPLPRLLGSSSIDEPPMNGTRDTYAVGPKQALIARMGQEDPSFKEYLDRNDVDPSRLDELTYLKRSSTIRRVLPLLVYRDSLIEFKDGRPYHRPRRKNTDECFTGGDAVSTALEGNPRWIKTAFSRMILSYDLSSTPNIPRGAQYDSLHDLAKRFESLLSLLASGEGAGEISVLGLVNRIAEYFHAENTGPFRSDPPGSFVVGADVPEPLREALRAAIYAGAVIHLRSQGSPTLITNLVGERFRLAHLLSYRKLLELPLRTGKEVQLGKILAASKQDELF